MAAQAFQSFGNVGGDISFFLDGRKVNDHILCGLLPHPCFSFPLELLALFLSNCSCFELGPNCSFAEVPLLCCLFLLSLLPRESSELSTSILVGLAVSSNAASFALSSSAACVALLSNAFAWSADPALSSSAAVSALLASAGASALSSSAVAFALLSSAGASALLPSAGAEELADPSALTSFFTSSVFCFFSSGLSTSSGWPSPWSANASCWPAVSWAIAASASAASLASLLSSPFSWNLCLLTWLTAPLPPGLFLLLRLRLRGAALLAPVLHPPPSSPCPPPSSPCPPPSFPFPPPSFPFPPPSFPFPPPSFPFPPPFFPFPQLSPLLSSTISFSFISFFPLFPPAPGGWTPPVLPAIPRWRAGARLALVRPTLVRAGLVRPVLSPASLGWSNPSQTSLLSRDICALSARAAGVKLLGCTLPFSKGQLLTKVLGLSQSCWHRWLQKQHVRGRLKTQNTFPYKT